ncbi:hypothetical protein J1605_019434 [Eschrichtius robustus]|uniref:ATP-dependent RNA helicase DDX60 PIN-like domain-containing protein n=1 Tax=Eschrichtius robustus TaxID=9764 RepID=A0AB34HPR7_ESCRO|nr:hypothetical protein J1605_019434 [Eschrichtius robustus]
MKVNAVLFSGQASDVLRLYAYFMPSKYRNRMFFQKKANIQQAERNCPTLEGSMYQIHHFPLD